MAILDAFAVVKSHSEQKGARPGAGFSPRGCKEKMKLVIPMSDRAV